MTDSSFSFVSSFRVSKMQVLANQRPLAFPSMVESEVHENFFKKLPFSRPLTIKPDQG
jgi:hypothetical protein